MWRYRGARGDALSPTQRGNRRHPWPTGRWLRGMVRAWTMVSGGSRQSGAGPSRRGLGGGQEEKEKNRAWGPGVTLRALSGPPRGARRRPSRKRRRDARRRGHDPGEGQGWRGTRRVGGGGRGTQQRGTRQRRGLLQGMQALTARGAGGMGRTQCGRKGHDTMLRRHCRGHTGAPRRQGGVVKVVAPRWGPRSGQA